MTERRGHASRMSEIDDGVTPYRLRHSGISCALAAGIPPSDVARFAGTSVAMLERVYAHPLSTSTDAARERLEAFWTRLGHGGGVTSSPETRKTPRLRGFLLERTMGLEPTTPGLGSQCSTD